MKQLQKERDEKKQLENWAATKIQAIYRGYLVRPRQSTYQYRQRQNTVANIRFDVSQYRPFFQ